MKMKNKKEDIKRTLGIIPLELKAYLGSLINDGGKDSYNCKFEQEGLMLKKKRIISKFEIYEFQTT